MSTGAGFLPSTVGLSMNHTYAFISHIPAPRICSKSSFTVLEHLAIESRFRRKRTEKMKGIRPFGVGQPLFLKKTTIFGG